MFKDQHVSNILKMDIEIDYTSCACNQTPTAAHWGKNNLICYASCNSIRIYNPSWGSGGKIIQTLYGHNKRVNSVRWILGAENETELVSGSSDGTAILWSSKNGKYLSYVLRGHTGNVNIVDGLYKSLDKLQVIILTASDDRSIKIWSRFNDECILIQNITFKYTICTSIRISFLPGSDVFIMACGMDDSKIRLYVEDELQFNLVETLPGHENWIRDLDFVQYNNDVMFASASQDTFIRLWRILPIKEHHNINSKEELILKKSRIKTKKKEFIICLESILAGHESWVYAVSWNSDNHTLLSASLDKTMIIWGYDEDAGLWLEKVRVGEVGGNTLGFYGGMFGPDNCSILAHGYHGAFHIWKKNAETDLWNPEVTISGHFNEVVDVSWEPGGEFIITVSTDQTTRVHAAWGKGNKEITWHEIARPQVHGYDMSCLAILSRYKFASGADEKIIRTFTAPNNFIENFRKICNVNDNENCNLGLQGAAVPSLGLSNKAVYAFNNLQRHSTNSANSYLESYITDIITTTPPTEETLLQNTLWPEIQKLYGHGYEVYCLASNSDGSLLASACKATNVEHATILLWDTAMWKIIQALPAHNLTVVQLKFSPNSEHLLSVSRDRRWTLFSKLSGCNQFERVFMTDKKTSIHSRIIWCCAWTHDSKYFATGSREGKVVFWSNHKRQSVGNILDQYGASCPYLEFKNESVTALDFAPIIIQDFYLLAVGFESGLIKLFKWNKTECSLCKILDKSEAHHLTVKKLAFRPLIGQAGKRTNCNVLQLCSVGSDHTIRIYNIKI